jgi:hypothetical protein
LFWQVWGVLVYLGVLASLEVVGGLGFIGGFYYSRHLVFLTNQKDYELILTASFIYWQA